MTAPLLRRLTAGLLLLPLLFGAGCSDNKTEKPSLTLSARRSFSATRREQPPVST